jgi:hypothetical protein
LDAELLRSQRTRIAVGGAQASSSPAGTDSGGFAQDARGRWYLNLQIEVPESQDRGIGEIGIDLGLNTLAALSDGTKIENIPVLPALRRRPG